MNLLPAPVFITTCMCQPIPLPMQLCKKTPPTQKLPLSKVNYSILLVLDSLYMSGHSSSPSCLSGLVHVVAESLDMLV
eukprot:8180831-Heterocapsa_arctica.AAC.1